MNEKTHKVVVWSLIIVAMAFFWISLRTNENELEYTLVALGIWGIAYIVNKKGKK